MLLKSKLTMRSGGPQGVYFKRNGRAIAQLLARGVKGWKTKATVGAWGEAVNGLSFHNGPWGSIASAGMRALADPRPARS